MILVVGDVVDDIGVRPLGTINAASDTESEIRMTPGGSAANVAAWLGRLGSYARFVGKAGADGVLRHVDALSAHGVDARITADAELPTATIVLTLDAAADRTMYVDRAANTTLKATDLPADIWNEIEWLHLTGYSFFDAGVRPIVIELMAEARRRSIGISVDPSSLGFLQVAGRDEFLSWVADADLLFPNDDEQRFLQLEGRAVVSRGSDGATFGDHSVAAAPTEVVDTTGAGDAFCAGFLSVWTKRREPAEALAAGAKAAAECVAVRGARPVKAR